MNAAWHGKHPILGLAGFASLSTWIAPLAAQQPGSIQNADGLRLLVAEENARPTLRIVLPRHPESDRSIEVVFPEHVTVRKHGSPSSEHLYLFRPGPEGERPA